MSSINTQIQPIKNQAFHNGKFIEVTEATLKGKWNVFILAVPAIHSAVPLTLPRASSAAPQQPAEPVRLDIDAQGRTYWNGKAVDEDALKAQAQQAAILDPQPVVRLSGDRAVAYERVLQTLSTLQGSGLTKVNFIAQKP